MKKIILAFGSLIVMSSCNQQKIGFVDNSELINEYQEKKDVESKIKAKVDAFQKRTDSLRQSFQLEIKEAELKARKMSQRAVQQLSQSLQEKEQVLSQRVQFERSQITNESQAKNDSLIKKVKSFVKNYAKTNGYTYILGSNEAGSVMYGDESNNLTTQVLKALNEDYAKSK